MIIVKNTAKKLIGNGNGRIRSYRKINPRMYHEGR